MEHVLFVQKVKSDRKQEYIKAHAEAWPSLLEAIRDSGIEREMIWMQDDTIYIYIMAEHFDRAMATLAETAVFKEWLAKMDPLLAVMQDFSGEGKVVRLPKVFDVELQLRQAGSQKKADGH